MIEKTKRSNNHKLNSFRMRIRIHSNSRVDVLNLKRKAYKKDKDSKPFRGVDQKKRSNKSKRNWIARGKRTQVEWLAGHEGSRPASTARSSFSQKSPKDEIIEGDDVDGRSRVTSNNRRFRDPSEFNGESKSARVNTDKSMENYVKQDETSDSDSSTSDSSSSSCSNYSCNDDSDNIGMIPLSSVTRSSQKLVSRQPVQRSLRHSCSTAFNHTGKGSDKENSASSQRKKVRVRRSSQSKGHCCNSLEVLHVHYKSPVVVSSSSGCETIQPGTGSKNLSFLMQHLAHRIRGDRGKEVVERRPSVRHHVLRSQTKHKSTQNVRRQNELKRNNRSLNCRTHTPHSRKYLGKKIPSEISTAIPKRIDRRCSPISHEEDYFPNFENITDFEDIPLTFEDFDISAFHEFSDYEEPFALEWELVDELVRESWKESTSNYRGSRDKCQCQDGSKVKQEAIEQIEKTLKRFENANLGSSSVSKKNLYAKKCQDKIFNLNTVLDSKFATCLSDAAN